MLRILFGGLALLLFVPAAFACDGQTGNVIFEDKFTDDSGVWIFGGALILTAPGATAMAPASDIGAAQTSLNQTFNATQGDFCMEMSYPPDAAQLNAGIGKASASYFGARTLRTTGLRTLMPTAPSILSSSPSSICPPLSRRPNGPSFSRRQRITSSRPAPRT